MEKLEQILHAEDSARTAADEAKSQAVRMIADARVRAAELVRTGREELRGQVAEQRERALEVAAREADELSAAASAAATDVLSGADARQAAAVAAVLATVKGRS